MRHLARNLAVWSLAAVFAVANVAGQGLHLLPGLGHNCCPPPLRSAAEVDHACHSCGDGDHASPRSHDVPIPGHTALAESPNSLLHAGNCPICQFMGQFKVSSECGPQLAVSSLVGEVPPLGAGRLAGFSLSAYDSRAPPA